MDARENVLSLVREAKLYKEQGLLSKSVTKYKAALSAVGEVSFEEQEALEKALTHAIHSVEGEIKEIRESDPNPDLSSEMKGLIRRLFSVSGDREIAEYKGAVALARFGQYGEALKEFNRLMCQGIMPAVAAKNILTCHMAFSSPEVAVAQLERWIVHAQFSMEELKDIHLFLDQTLKKEGAQAALPPLSVMVKGKEDWDDESDGDLPITGVCLPALHIFDNEEEELEVVNHSGNTISLQIPPEREDLLDALKFGAHIDGMRFFSPMAVFEGKGIVIGRREIDSGPKKGSFGIDIHIEGS